jgi:hypothetical protein
LGSGTLAATKPLRRKHCPANTEQLTLNLTRDPQRCTGVIVAICYCIVVVGVWVAPIPPANWAIGDARDYHFPIINYFIQHGFDLNYPPDLVAMFPGMHMYFASVARAFGWSELGFTSAKALLVQSVLGILLLCALYRVAVNVTRSPAAVVILMLPVLSSSFVLYSWVWPTTDLGSLAFYTWMLALLVVAPRPTAGTSLAHSLLTGAAVMFRQSSAVMGAASLANIIVRAITHRAKKPSLASIALSLPPIIVALVCVGWLISIWGGLVPTGFQRHVANGFSIVSGVHIFALSGLIAWPFALPQWRVLAKDRRLLIGTLAGALAIAILCCMALPLEFNIEAGRSNSLIWNLQRVFLHHPFDIAFVGVMIAIGSFLWISMLVACCKRSDFPPELVMFGLFAASLLVQKTAWQRYVEPQLLLTLGVYFSRQEMARNDSRFIVAAYCAYGAISLIHTWIIKI